MPALPEAAPRVVLLRSPDAGGADRYVRALARSGFRAVCRPVLRFVVAGEAGFAGGDVNAHLREPERFSGLILTSPRAARVLARGVEAVPGGRDAWREKPAFAVGPKTARVLREQGLAPTGEESGDAATLAAHVARRQPATADPLLFVCGNRRREALPARLRAAGVAFTECVAYETHLRSGPWLADEPEWAVFFSPSGVEAVQRAQKGAAPETGWTTVRKGAFGPTTAGALREAGWRPEAVADTPTPEGLAEALVEARLR